MGTVEGLVSLGVGVLFSREGEISVVGAGFKVGV